MSKTKHVGSSFDDFLKSEGLLESSRAIAAERVATWLRKQNLTFDAFADEGAGLVTPLLPTEAEG